MASDKSEAGNEDSPLQKIWEEQMALLPYDEIHACPATVPREDYAIYGPAITDIVRSGDRWWAVTMHEYASPVHFCPWCGMELATAE